MQDKSPSLFVPLSPELLVKLENDQTIWPSSSGVSVNLEGFYPLLPELEAEILYLMVDCGKIQKDVAELLQISQPSVSYRYRRALEKIGYLACLKLIDLDKFVDEVPKLRDKERQTLKQFCLVLNQEAVAYDQKIRQSSVKWIISKSIRYLTEAFVLNQGKWYPWFIFIKLVEKNMRVRVK